MANNAIKKRELLYEGKAKQLFQGDEEGTLISRFKDDATAFNNEKKGVIRGKGVINNLISAYIMEILDEAMIPTHFIRTLNMREQLVHSVEIIPLEVIIRNYVAGSFAKKYGAKEGLKLTNPLIEYSLKDDDLGDPMLSENHIEVMGIASEDDMETINILALRINDILIGMFAAANLRLIDFKVEFGYLYSQEEDEEVRLIVLADEITPDSCRLWDMKTNKKLDKDRFRHDMGGVEDAYLEVARRLGVLPNNAENIEDINDIADKV